MKRRLILGLSVCAALVCALFFCHVAAMRPSAEALCRAEALEYLLSQADPECLPTMAPYLSGEPALSAPPAEGETERVGDRMLRSEDTLYYVRPGDGRTIAFVRAEQEAFSQLGR
ncbi:MAG: hypothetical protein K6G17_06615 [Oscillospiraceae bacterium]|nr:hypothetical protein [Oscillospiraceae bacterium]